MFHAALMLHYKPAQAYSTNLTASATVDAFVACQKQDKQTSHQSACILNHGLQSIYASVMPAQDQLCSPAGQVENVDDLMDKSMPVKFLEIDQERERLVFSARKAADNKQLKTYNVSHLSCCSGHNPISMPCGLHTRQSMFCCLCIMHMGQNAMHHSRIGHQIVS